MFGLVYVLKRFVLPGGAAAQQPVAIEVLGRKALQPKKSVVVLKIAERVLVVGLSEQGMQTLTELSSDELQQPGPVTGPVASAVQSGRLCRPPAGHVEHAGEPEAGEEERMKRVVVVILLCVLVAGAAYSQDRVLPMPKLSVEVGKATKPDDVAVTLQILFLMTILSLAPAILILTTAFTRIVVVLHFLRQAMGTQQIPPSQVLIGLAMFLTFFVMAPTWNRVNQDAIQPYMKNTIIDASRPTTGGSCRSASSCSVRPGKRTWRCS